MIKIIPFTLLAGLFLGSCDCLSDICGSCCDESGAACCEEAEAPAETPSEE